MAAGWPLYRGSTCATNVALFSTYTASKSLSWKRDKWGFLSVDVLIGANRGAAMPQSHVEPQRTLDVIPASQNKTACRSKRDAHTCPSCGGLARRGYAPATASSTDPTIMASVAPRRPSHRMLLTLHNYSRSRAACLCARVICQQPGSTRDCVRWVSQARPLTASPHPGCKRLEQEEMNFDR